MNDHVSNIASQLGIEIAPDWSGLDAVWPLIERMRADRAVVLIKLDGERTGPRDSGPYTLLVSGTPLGDELIRADAMTLREGLSYLISHYAAAVWGIPLST